jgi:methyl-accepting chemotaxis protein
LLTDPDAHANQYAYFGAKRRRESIPSVEAARAGEQGRGFAVVESEVRTLAHRSAAAAKEIKVLIDDSVGRVDEGARLVDQAGVTMNEVVRSVKNVTDIISEITAASAEQTSGIEQINEAVILMDQVTQQNAALVEEAAAASQAMRDQVQGLSAVVASFKTAH